MMMRRLKIMEEELKEERETFISSLLSQYYNIKDNWETSDDQGLRVGQFKIYLVFSWMSNARTTSDDKSLLMQQL